VLLVLEAAAARPVISAAVPVASLIGVYPDPAAALAAAEVAGTACAVRNVGYEIAGVGSTGQCNGLGEGSGWCFVAQGRALMAWRGAAL
jgi:hypothetical protein